MLPFLVCAGFLLVELGMSWDIGLREVFLSHRMGKGMAGMGSVCGYVYGEWNYIMSGLGHWHSCNTL